MTVSLIVRQSAKLSAYTCKGICEWDKRLCSVFFSCDYDQTGKFICLHISDSLFVRCMLDDAIHKGDYHYIKCRFLRVVAPITLGGVP